MEQPRLAIIASHPIQYWVPVYQQLAAQKDLVLNVFYVAENGVKEYFDTGFNRSVKWDRPLTKGYDFEFLRQGDVLSDFKFSSVDSTTLGHKLQGFCPDFILVNGYGHKINWRALLTKPKHTKVLYISDSNVLDTRSFWRKTIKKIPIRVFFHKVDYFLATSPSNTKYLIDHGVDERDIFQAPLPSDIVWFDTLRKKITQQTVLQLRDDLGLSAGHKVILFAGKLLPHKRPQDVLKLMAKLQDQNVSALFVGSGELLEDLKRLSRDLGISSNVKFVGFVNQSRLAQYFSLSDIFIFPSSREPYGLIASEVLPFGLPIIAAENIGAVGAAIRDGINGFIYPCANINELTKHTKRLLGDKELYEKMSHNSQQLAMQYDVGQLVNRILSICKSEKL